MIHCYHVKMKILTKVCLKTFHVINHSLLESQMN